jgi:hypothetical protein
MLYLFKRQLIPWLSTFLIFPLTLVSLAGCSSTKQPSNLAPAGTEVKTSGFLGDLYPLLRDGEGDEALRVYRNPKMESPAVFAQYSKILLEPVVIYAGPDSKLPEAPLEQRETIAKAFYAQLYDKLSKDYEMVMQPGPNTLKVQVAIVDAEESSAYVEALSYLPIPVGIPGAKLALVQLKTVSTGKPPFAGEVSIEGKVSDTQTGEIVSAVIDRRVGARKPIIGLFQGSTYDSWNDVDEAMRYWAERLRYRFCVRRGGSDCITPEE